MALTKEQIEENKRKRLEEEEEERRRLRIEKLKAKENPSRPNTFIEDIQGRVPRPVNTTTDTTETRDTSNVGFSQLTTDEKTRKMEETGKTGAELELEERGKLGIPEVIRDQDTGKITGITMPDGRSFFGTEEEVRAMAAKNLAQSTDPAGTAQAGAAQEQARIAGLVNNIGQVGGLTAAEEAGINFSQAITAGLARVAPSAIGGAAGGALLGGVAGAGAGSSVTAPAGAIIGGAGGAITGFVSGILGNIKEQQSGELRAAKVELTNARTNMRQLAMLASRDPANADIYIQQYNQQLTRVHQARRQTQAEVQGDLNSFMEDGREQLADFDAFLIEGGTAEIYALKLAASLESGVPLSILGEELV